MSKEKKIEKEEFEPIDIREPRPGYSILSDIALYIHPLSSPNISEEDGYIEISNINGAKANIILIENTCTFTDLDASYYKLVAEDIDTIRIKCINSDVCNIILYPERGNDIRYLMKMDLYITILKNTVIINTDEYQTDACENFQYKCILDYL